jgi:acyl-CoA synthetase (AMP-forming)/AMP-acid ligase II
MVEQSICATPYEWLAEHAKTRPDGPALAVWKGSTVTLSWDWETLHEEVDRRLLGLEALGIGPGDRVVMVLPNDESFATVMLACSGRGAIVVPAPIPTAGRREAFIERLAGIIDACDPALIVTADGWLEEIRRLTVAVKRPAVPVSELLSVDGVPDPRPAQDGIVLLQFTSGSTKRPRGVEVTVATLAANCWQAALAYAESPEDTAVTWVPLFHDMGLVTGVMRPLFQGYQTVLLSPEEFVRDPASWLRAIDECGGTVASAPNFGYDLCVRKVQPDRVRTFDLSRWRIARNAGEVVTTRTMRRFRDHFAAAGFPASALAPSYGLAEATLTVTSSGPDIPPVDLPVSASALAEGEVTVLSQGMDGSGERDGTRWLTSSGVPLEGTAVRISSDRADQVGEIHVCGPQLARGYWMPKGGEVPDSLTVEGPDGAPWLATGDLGFVHDGHLFVLGRADDTLTVQGRNVFGLDIAAVCEGFIELRPGRVAAFIAEGEPTDPSSGVQLCAEVSDHAPADLRQLDRLARRVRGALVRRLDLFVKGVQLLPKGSLPVTTSGKIRVRETRTRYEKRLFQPLVLNSDTARS